MKVAIVLTQIPHPVEERLQQVPCFFKIWRDTGGDSHLKGVPLMQKGKLKDTLGIGHRMVGLAREPFWGLMRLEAKDLSGYFELFLGGCICMGSQKKPGFCVPVGHPNHEGRALLIGNPR